MEGYAWRREQRINETAYFVANLMNLQGKTLKSVIKPQSLAAPLLPPKGRDWQKDKKDLQDLFGDRMK